MSAGDEAGAGRSAGGDPAWRPGAGSPDPTVRFSGRAELYERYRPGYPPEVLDVLRAEVGLEPGWVVADVGSGTGLSSEPFLDAGHPVYAVEPNAEMRAAAEARLGDRPGFRSVDGRAEATTLPAASVDLAVAGQAFHWFDPGTARREFLRILRRPWAVLLFNRRRTEGTPFLEAYEALLLRYGTDYERVRHDRRAGEALRLFYPLGHGRRTLPNEQVLDREGLVGRTLSCSYAPEAGHPDHRPMLAALARLFARHAEDGTVRLEYDVEVYFGCPLAA